MSGSIFDKELSLETTDHQNKIQTRAHKAMHGFLLKDDWIQPQNGPPRCFPGTQTFAPLLELGWGTPPKSPLGWLLGNSLSLTLRAGAGTTQCSKDLAIPSRSPRTLPASRPHAPTEPHPSASALHPCPLELCVSAQAISLAWKLLPPSAGELLCIL